ncbi:hypothetical protein [Nitriliruptor alkaliphilus]|uniref:hypothetical protein n=1 Tax=Nitriliruptor alkaliphilus TaxID=427918 RepID=UPI000697FFDC|nr:hypothetical protein [Nitriliruptor alkaliphilus]
MTRWERFWFAPGSALAWIVVRAVVLSTVAIDVWNRRHSFGAIPGRAEVVWEPISALALLPLGSPGRSIPVAVGLALVASITALAHVRPRLSAAVAAGAYGYLVLAANSLGKIDHDRQPLVIMLVVVVLAAAPRGGEPPDWRFRWPVQACRVALAAMLAAAAWSKVIGGGLAWVTSENMRNILAAEVLGFRDPPLSEVALWVASDPWRWRAAALGAVLGELALLAALVTRRVPVRTALIAAGVGTVLGITLLMGLVGFPIVVLGAVLIDADRMLARWEAGTPRWHPLVVPGLGAAALAVTTYLATSRLLLTVPALVAPVLLAVAAWSAGRGGAGGDVGVDLDGRAGRLASRPWVQRTEEGGRTAPGPARR